jgi:hypothetical protein
MYGSGEIKRLLKVHRVNFCLPARNEHIALDLVEVVVPVEQCDIGVATICPGNA